MKLNKFLASVLMVLSIFCSFAFAKAKPQENNSQLKIVTTIFPEYDWVMNILGEKASDAQVKNLLDSGVDLHSYQPTVKDMASISNSNLFIYVGGESDEWVEDVLKNCKNSNFKALNLLEILGDRVRHEEVKEGMEADHHHHHEDGHHHDDDEDEHEHHHHEDGHHHDDEDCEEEFDEHVWLSVKNAAILCDAICDALCQIDSANAAVYQKNTTAYKNQLAALDAEFEKAVKNAKQKTLLFGDRFPFVYLTSDYGIEYFAAFVGCSAETEASFKTIAFLSNKVDELKLSSVCTIEKSDGRIAKAIIKNSKSKNAKIVEFDSLQASTSKDASSGKTYLGTMKANLEALKKALN
ncbi:MAG: metal ABC transporter substrate-binding protein [Treponemataceae bacterium]|nr:metal ABC transporter substrate-binding protein [Treponemataceae bacterium]